MFFRKLSLSILTAAVALAVAQSPALYGQGEQPLVAGQRSYAATRITAPVNDDHLATLRGNVHPLAQAQYDRGAAPASMQTGRIVLLLKGSQQQQDALRQYLGELQNPASPNYRHWLTPEQFGRLYGATDQDIATVTSWLEGKGFQVAKVAKARNAIQFSGNAAQIKAAFHTEIHRYQVNGEMHLANASDPQIPAALAPVVAGVAQLNDFYPHSYAKRAVSGHYDPESHSFRSDLTYTTKGGQNILFVTPADAATIYDAPNSALNSAYSGPTYDGTGVTIGIAGDSNITATDVANYRRLFLGSSANQPNIIVDGNDPGVNGDAVEALLDLEVSGGLAPGAKVNFYVSENTDLQAGLFLAIYRALDDNQVSILNVSFGLCEAFQSTDGNAAINSAWQQAAAQGISVTVSSGDAGSAGCDDQNTVTVAQDGLAVNGLASTPYNIAVGGTDYTVLATNFTQYANTANGTLYGSAKGYIPETPWNNSVAQPAFLAQATAYKDSQGKTNIVGAGGGISTCINPTTSGSSVTCVNASGYAQPSFQSGVVASTYNSQAVSARRTLPDVSLLASDGSYGATWLVCLDAQVTGQSSDDCTGSQFSINGVGGTSAAAPAFAGMLAVISQAQSGVRLGQADTVLYSLYKQDPTLFHDVTQGTISVTCKPGSLDCGSNSFLKGFDAGAGYDLATGLGSPDLARIAKAWGNVRFVASTTTLTINGSPAAYAGVHGANLSLAATVMPTTASGAVVLQTGGSGPIDNSKAALVLQNGAAAGTYNGLPGGTYNLTGYYAGDAVNGPSTSNAIAVSISPEPSITALSVAVYDPSTGQPISGGSVPYGFFVTATAQPYGKASAVSSGGAITPDGIPTGTVVFSDNGAQIPPSPVAVASNGAAFYSNPGLALGGHQISATYSGDPSFGSSTAAASSATSFTIVQATTTTTVTPSATSIASTGQVTLTATVGTDSVGLFPTGTITFFSNGKALGTAVPVKGGADPKTGLANATATLVVTGNQLTSAARLAGNQPGLLPWKLAGGSAVLAFALFFTVPARRRSWQSLLGLVLFAISVSVGIGCGSSANSNTGGGSGGSGGITAQYSGDTNYSTSTSTSVAVTVK